MRSNNSALSRSGIVLPLLAFLLGAAATEWNFLTKGLSIIHLNSVASITIFQLKLFQDNLLAGICAPITWTKAILTGLPLSGGLPTFNPLFIPPALLFDFTNAVIAYEIALKVLGATGMYCLLKHMRLSTGTAVTAGLLFIVNPFFAATGQDPQFGAVVFWTPWVALLVLRHVESRHFSAIQAVGTGVVAALSYLSANTLSLFFLVMFLVLPALASLTLFSGHKDKRGLIVTLVKTFCVTAAVFLALCAFDIVPGADILSHSGRTKGLFRVYALEAGFVVLVHAGLCRLFFQGRRVSFLLALLVACAALAAGLHALKIPLLPQHAPGTALGPETFVFNLQNLHYLLTYAQAALALAGLTALKRGGPAAVLSILGLAWWAFLPAGIDMGYANRAAFVPVFCLSVLAALGIETVARFCSIQSGPHRLAAAGLCLLVVLEAYGAYFSNTLFTPALEALSVESPETEYVRRHRGRVAFTYASHQEVRDRIVSVRSPIWLEWLMSGYHGGQPFCFNGINILPPVLNELAPHAYPKFFGLPVNQPTNNFLHLAGVGTVVSRFELPADPDLRLAVKGDAYFVYENTARLPRLRLVGTLTVLPRDQIFEALARADKDQLMDLAYTDVAVPGASGDPAKNGRFEGTETSFQSESGKLTLLEDADTRTRIACDVKRASCMVLADTYDPRWEVRLDGRDAPLLCVNGAFVGVWLPEGVHEVALEYAPPVWRAAGWLSLGSWIGALLLLPLGAWRQRSTVLR